MPYANEELIVGQPKFNFTFFAALRDNSRHPCMLNHLLQGKKTGVAVTFVCTFKVIFKIKNVEN